MTALYERLIALREKNCLSQTEVARALKVTPALISAYEKGERKPSLERLSDLADLYHSTTDYILGRREEDHSGIFLDVSHLSENQLRIIRELIGEMKKEVF